MSEYKLAITFQVSFKAVLLWGMIVQTQGMKVFEKVVIQKHFWNFLILDSVRKVRGVLGCNRRVII